MVVQEITTGKADSGGSLGCPGQSWDTPEYRFEGLKCAEASAIILTISTFGLRRSSQRT
jgi:hypothetical protein